MLEWNQDATATWGGTNMDTQCQNKMIKPSTFMWSKQNDTVRVDENTEHTYTD
jgi:hypothetical protein